MAATMWRMTVALLLCAVLLNNGVMSQDDDATDATDSPATDATDSPVDTADADPQVSVDSDATAAPGDGTDASTDGAGSLFVVTALDMDSFTGLPDFAIKDDTSGTSGTTVLTVMVAGNADTQGTEAPETAPAAPDTPAPLQRVFPVVECVDKDDLANKNIVKAVVATTDCEETRGLLQGTSAAWCHADSCRLDIFQEGNKLLVASPDAQMSTVVEALESEHKTGPLGVSEVRPQPAAAGSSVFVAVLLTGLLLAAALIGGYCLKTRRGASPKGMRLAEEAYPTDETNQGNTLVSVAPLNPPAETPEKPSVNGGEAPEPEKIQPPPPTNGHSTAKNADTEL